MLFRQKTIDKHDIELAEKIKKELTLTFQKKGINISEINIDLTSGKVNVSMNINKGSTCRT